MAQPETNSPSQGSVADVAARLALWGKRAAKGLARVEFISDFSRQAVITDLRTALPQTLPLYEIELPFQQSSQDVVRFLLDRLRDLPAGVVSVTGFATAFSVDVPLEDALRVLNFHREELAKFPLCQIWWMTSPFTDAFLRFIPDLDSWFLVRLNLSEVIVDESVEQLPFSHTTVTYNVEFARKQSTDFIARFEKVIGTNAPASSFVDLAYVATLVLGNANLDHEQYELANRLLDKMTPTLLSQGLLEEESEALQPNHTLISGPHYYRLSENFRMLGQLCKCAGRTDEAETFYKASLEIELNSTDWFLGLSSAFQSIINFYVALSRFSEAEILCKQWIDVEENGSGRGSYQITLALDKLLGIYLSAEKYIEAEQIFYRMLFLARFTIPDVLLETSLKDNMAWFYKRLGRYAEADLLTQQALQSADEK